MLKFYKQSPFQPLYFVCRTNINIQYGKVSCTVYNLNVHCIPSHEDTIFILRSGYWVDFISLYAVSGPGIWTLVCMDCWSIPPEKCK